ncbi:hypothetical protein F7725_017889 [Dissostichus mawsoni]|uniref:Uncharacterized protein n=1 Tax=Dissostichus mawsoni TaxID=36200 RepID=A0A7J5XQ25_DISMA|nr:hypothetical protein F7725_017889 [Dissostichus mawsoni]
MDGSELDGPLGQQILCGEMLIESLHQLIHHQPHVLKTVALNTRVLRSTGGWLVSTVILNLVVLAGEEGTHTNARGRLNLD